VRRALRQPPVEHTLIALDRLLPHRSQIAVSVAAVAVLAAISATPQLLGAKVSHALDDLSAATPS
jgi:hypothetical protein